MSGDDIRRAVPHSVEAEQSVLGALLMDNDSVDRMGDLRAEHFFRGDHRAIFAAVMAAIEGGKPADPLTVGDKLPEIGIEYLNALAMNTPSSANIGRYAEIVRERAQKRGLLAIASDIEAMTLVEQSPAAGELIDAVQGRIDALSESAVKSEPVRVGDDLANYVDELERRREGGVRAIPTGFDDLDALLSGGIRRGEVVVVAARPKIGKTALALAIARNVAHDHGVLVLEMEMPKTQIHDRNMAATGRIALDRLLNPSKLDKQDWDRVTAAMGRMTEWNLHIDDQGGLRLLDVRTKARSVKRRYGLDLLVIDYLQLMEADGDNRNAQIESITRGIKALAKELNIGIVLLSQLNRQLESRPNKRPMPSDLRDSGGIEQDCDVAIFLYSDAVYNPDSPDKGIVEAHVALNRQGANGTVGLAYIGEQTRFENLEPGVVFGLARMEREKESRPRAKYSGLRD